MSLLIPGLLSITFRKLTPPQIVELMVKAKLKALEWGGDIHVPHGDIARAREVRRWTTDAGLSVAAYGSYYRLGNSETNGLSFQSVLDSALALGAPTIRIWPGVKGSTDATAQERRKVIADAVRVAEMAQAQGVSVSLEYHSNTLTDARDSVRRLLGEITHPNLKFLWQDVNGESLEENLARLHDVFPRVQHVHVFNWSPEGARLSLAEGEARWQRYLEIIRTAAKPMPCLIEFVRDDTPEQFLQDAATLLCWTGVEK